MRVAGDGNCQVYQLLVPILSIYLMKVDNPVTLLIYVHVFFFGFMQFRALSDQLYRSPDYHRHVRKEIVKQVCQSPGHIGRNTFQIYVNKLIWLNCKFLYAATHAFPLCYFVALCLTVLVCLLSCESIKNFFLIVDLFFCETHMLTLHMLFFSLCSSRNVTPCTKVMFQ